MMEMVLTLINVKHISQSPHHMEIIDQRGVEIGTCMHVVGVYSEMYFKKNHFVISSHVHSLSVSKYGVVVQLLLMSEGTSTCTSSVSRLYNYFWGSLST